MNLIYDLIINIIDYLIIFKYFKSFSEKRTMKKKLYDSFLWMHNFD